MADPECPPDLDDAARMARVALAELDRLGARLGPDGRRRIVETLGHRLAHLAGDHACADDRRRRLLAWRDRLGSYVLAARALDELDVHADAADQFLRRGLVELLTEVSPRAVA